MPVDAEEDRNQAALGMREDRLRELADKLDGLDRVPRGSVRMVYDPDPDKEAPLWFDLLSWKSQWRLPEGGCGTAACVAGWACHLFSEKSCRELDGEEGEEAAGLLGLDAYEAARLFVPWAVHGAESTVTPGQAAAAVRKVADGVDPKLWWSHVKMQKGWPADLV